MAGGTAGKMAGAGVVHCFLGLNVVKYFDSLKCETTEETEMFEPKIRNRQTDLLMKAVMLLRDEEDAYRFFEDLCTIPEIKSISQRLEVAELLRKKETYQEIALQTGASSATISRVNRALNYGADGYNRVLSEMEKE